MVSIIIPTCNRAAYLADTLSSLNAIPAISAVELIVIDNGSTDTTRDVVSRFSQISSFPVRYIYEPTPGLHVGRNLGAQLARGEVLAYLDDDIFVDPNWLAGIQDTLTKYPDFALLGGPCVPHWEAPPPDWLMALQHPSTDGGWVLSQLSLLDLGYQAPASCSPWHILGCNFIIKKSVLFAAGGFHPDGMPDHLLRYRGDGESYLSQYVMDNGLCSLYHPSCKICHRVPAKRLTYEYIKYISVRNIYSQAYMECRKTNFSILKLLSLFMRLGKRMTKALLRFLVLRQQAGQEVRDTWLMLKLCFFHTLSPHMRTWISQASYFKEDSCPYR